MTRIDTKPNTTAPRYTAPRYAAYRRVLFAGACAALASLAGAPGASAQMVGFMPDVFVDIDEPEPRIQPRGVVRRLQNRGFVEIGRPRFDGQAYIVDATHPSGSRLRLVLDAYDGAMLGRRVIGQANPSQTNPSQAYPAQAYPPQQRVARAAPGYGWTEDEPAMRRGGREFGGPIPPADIPMPGGRRRDAAFGAEPPGPPEGYGANPDGKARSGPAARKSARLSQPQKPAQPPAVPSAPEAKLDSPQAASPKEAVEKRDAASPAAVKPVDSNPADVQSEGAGDITARTGSDGGKSDGGKSDSGKSDAVSRDAAKAKADQTPDASDSPTTGAAGPASVTTPATNQPAAAKESSETQRDQAWRDIEPTKKNVRVIDGATIVPGSESAPSGTN